MTCWMKLINDVKGYLMDYAVTEEDAKDILKDVENEVGHNIVRIRETIEKEKTGLIRRLKKRKKAAEVAYN